MRGTDMSIALPGRVLRENTATPTPARPLSDPRAATAAHIGSRSRRGRAGVGVADKARR